MPASIPQKPVFCFIDDARFELDNFARNAAPFFGGVEWVLALDWKQCLEKLAGRRPLCFLLDLWGAGENGPRPELPWPGELEEALAGLRGPAEILRQAAGQPDPANSCLRDLHAQVSRWQGAFALAAAKLGQSPAFGLANLALVRKHFPWAAALGYSRKALFQDAHAFTLAGGCGCLQKPQGDGPEPIAAATRAQAAQLAGACRAAVSRRLALACPGQAGLSRLCPPTGNQNATPKELAEIIEIWLDWLAAERGPEQPPLS